MAFGVVVFVVELVVEDEAVRRQPESGSSVCRRGMCLAALGQQTMDVRKKIGALSAETALTIREIMYFGTDSSMD